MKKVPLLLCLATLLIAAPTAKIRAETVTLATGEIVEGKILSETNDQITVEVKVSESISDERVIHRTDIKSIERTNPEIEAFAEIKTIRLNQQYSLKPETYDRDITALTSFLKAFPDSPHNAEVKSTLGSLKAEQARVNGGSVKFLGKWLSGDEAEKRAVQIQGQQTFDSMKAQTSRQDLIGAMNTFDQIEKKYSTTRIYPDAIDLARQILTALQRQIADRLRLITYNQNEFQTELSRAKPEDVPRLNEAAKREQDQFIAAIAAAKKNGLKWIPFFARSPESMAELQSNAVAELTRLNALPVQQMRASIGMDDEAISAIASKDMTNAASLLEDALKAWPQNNEATYWKTEIASAKPTGSPTPSAATNPRTAAREGASAPASANNTPAVAPQEDEKPFYMTVRGALTIAGGVFVILGGITLLGRLQKPKPESK